MKGKHQWNSRGSEAGKDERKQTGAKYRNLKGSTGNRVEREMEKSESESGMTEAWKLL